MRAALQLIFASVGEQAVRSFTSSKKFDRVCRSGDRADVSLARLRVGSFSKGKAVYLASGGVPAVRVICEGSTK